MSSKKLFVPWFIITFHKEAVQLCDPLQHRTSFRFSVCGTSTSRYHSVTNPGLQRYDDNRHQEQRWIADSAAALLLARQERLQPSSHSPRSVHTRTGTANGSKCSWVVKTYTKILKGIKKNNLSLTLYHHYTTRNILRMGLKSRNMLMLSIFSNVK